MESGIKKYGYGGLPAMMAFILKNATTFSTKSRQSFWLYKSADVAGTTTAQELRFLQGWGSVSPIQML
jgi:hypothetical protein